MNHDRNLTFSVSEQVLFQKVSGETVLLDLTSERYFGLDAIGTRIWALVNEGKSAGQMLDQLLGEYEVDPATLESDLYELLENLLESGLIRVQTPAGKTQGTSL